MKNVGIIFAGGIGRRMNSKALPKQFLKLHEKEIIIYTLEHFENHAEIDGIVIACVEEWIPFLERLIKRYDIHKVAAVVPGGKTGQESIYNALCAAKINYGEDAVVLVHDGVRPLIDSKTITDSIKCVHENGSAITIAPANETIVSVDRDSKITNIVDRNSCAVARAPQSFFLGELLNAHKRAISEKQDAFIDSASLMRYYGHSLTSIVGPVENIKITTPMDFYTFRALSEAKESAQLFGV
ncbi:2-C-methyl-D-erythritol 4-phosphate cytidylyltransferase [Lactonifactor longoviformis]|uniref:IspD/TarI family cytidylyltransferase n=1 Tax=Lactonifactor longoviformis TaxID=341220 RepID=UPI0036F1C8FE